MEKRASHRSNFSTLPQWGLILVTRILSSSEQYFWAFVRRHNFFAVKIDIKTADMIISLSDSPLQHELLQGSIVDASQTDIEKFFAQNTLAN